MKNLVPPKTVPPGPNISKYLDPPELIFQKHFEICGPSLKTLFPIFGSPKSLFYCSPLQPRDGTHGTGSQRVFIQ